VRQALDLLDAAAGDGGGYDPSRSERTFRLYLTDIGETIFLPPLMAALSKEAPRVTIEAHQLDHAELEPALDSGRLDLALGFIPSLDVERTVLLHERYVVAMRRGHPLARLRPTVASLGRLEYALVRAHPATTRALHDLGLAGRIRLSIPHFMVLPRILAETDPRGRDALAPLRRVRAHGSATRCGGRASGMPSFDVSVHWADALRRGPGARVAA
jgi:DNA-binding transcriptional LysR family regulator